MHRDIKPTNINCTEKNSVKFIDLGTLQIFPENSDKVKLEYCGTLKYMAPELLEMLWEPNKMVEGNPFKLDLFSLGLSILDIIKPSNSR